MRRSRCTEDEGVCGCGECESVAPVVPLRPRRPTEVLADTLQAFAMQAEELHESGHIDGVGLGAIGAWLDGLRGDLDAIDREERDDLRPALAASIAAARARR